MTVRVGVIGTGIMGADHVTTLHRQVAGAAVTMVADLDLDRAQAVAAALPEVRATDDGFGLIGDPAVDAVVVASDDATHADLTAAAVQAGKPVLCEKPLAPTLPECLRVVQAETEAVGAGETTLVSVGFMRRFDPGYLELKSALEAGACGTPLQVHCVSCGVSSAPGSTSESSVTGSAIHEFDAVPWLLDARIVEVSWQAPRSTGAVPGMQDPQLMLLRTADGALTTVEVFLNARYGFDIRCEIVGDRGTIGLANPARVVADADRRRATGYPADWRPRFADAYRIELQAWVDAVAAGRPSPLATARDGLIANAVADAVITSMHHGGRTVAVELPDPRPARDLTGTAGPHPAVSSQERTMPSFPKTLPAARTPPSQAAPALRWGLLGTGWIADRFIRSLQRHTRQQVLAVGSRDADRSTAFAGRHGLPRGYGSYEELVADPDIDIVYVATPHPAHHPCAKLALDAGKHILVEKPLGLNAAQAAETAQLATDRGRFCAEALWTFFLPKFDVVRQLLEAGSLGEIRTVQADYGEHFTADHRIMRPELAGGPLLDLGTYPVSLATWVLGAPERVLAAGQPHTAGVNGQTAVILCDPHGNQAVLHTTLYSNTPTTATIAGTHGTLTLPGPFYQPGDLLLISADGDRQLAFTEPRTAHDALHFEAAEVARCIAAGRLESPIRPLAESIATLRVMDEIRRLIGVTFPDEH